MQWWRYSCWTSCMKGRRTQILSAECINSTAFMGEHIPLALTDWNAFLFPHRRLSSCRQPANIWVLETRLWPSILSVMEGQNRAFPVLEGASQRSDFNIASLRTSQALYQGEVYMAFPLVESFGLPICGSPRGLSLGGSPRGLSLGGRLGTSSNC